MPSSSATAASARSCARCCEQHGIPYIAADSDALAVTRDRREGHDVYYGDAADPRFLETLRPGHGGRRHHHHPLAPGHRRCRRARARAAPRHSHRLARARRRSRPPSLRPRRHRCRAGDDRSEPSAFRSGAGRPWRRRSDRRSPRSTKSADEIRRTLQQAARDCRPLANSFDQSQIAQDAGVRRPVAASSIWQTRTRRRGRVEGAGGCNDAQVSA